jgi:general secretion pathway protein D
VLNFDNADIETVIHAASEIVGFNYVLGPDVRGKVTVQTSGRIPQEDVFGVLLAILELHGFTAVRSDNLYKIIRIEGARERAVPTIIGTAPDPARVTDEIITQIVPVRFASVADLSTLLRPLISARGTLIASRETNMLIITDAASNIRRLLDIIRLVDVEVALEELQIIQVKYADVAELAAILTQLFASGRLRTSGPLGPGAPAAPPAPAPVAPGTPAAPRPPAPTPGEAVERAPLIVPERRSNSLIVHARKHEMETIRRLIGQLDVDIYGGRRVFVYYAENARAKELTATLNAIYGARETVAVAAPSPPLGLPRPGDPPPPPSPAPAVAPGRPVGGTGELGRPEGEIRFIADEPTNSVIVTTFPRNWQEIEQTIRQLDRMPRQVLIEVLVAEISLTDDTQLGIDWAIRSGRFRAAQQSISEATPPTITSPATQLPPLTSLVLPGAGLTAFAFNSERFFAMLNALAAETRVNVVSSPHVLTSENKRAVINVSTSIPIVTSQQVPIGGTTVPTAPGTSAIIGTQSVEYRDAGVVLTVTPRIGERGTVALDVKQEVNDIGEPEPPTGSRRINKREAETSVVLLNNQTLVLAGLITDRRGNTDRGIPLLNRIPVLGYLFGFRSDSVEKRELIILITPRVIGTALDAARITEELRSVTPELERAIRSAPRPPAIGVPPAMPGAPAPVPVPPPPAPGAPGASAPLPAPGMPVEPARP